MAFEIFGFQFKPRRKEDETHSIVAPTGDDGSTVLSTSAAAYYTQVVDLDTNIKNENELIKRYREISLYSEVDAAIEDILEYINGNNFGNVHLQLKVNSSSVTELDDYLKKYKLVNSKIDVTQKKEAS